jgi:hypothetical protein
MQNPDASSRSVGSSQLNILCAGFLLAKKKLMK